MDENLVDEILVDDESLEQSDVDDADDAEALLTRPAHAINLSRKYFTG